MSHTETQAKLLWCPMARAWDGYTAAPLALNRSNGDKPATNCLCLASGCAVWVWDASGELPGLLAAKDYVEAHPELIEKHGGKIRAIAAWREANRKPGSVATGHCGLIQRG